MLTRIEPTDFCLYSVCYLTEIFFFLLIIVVPVTMPPLMHRTENHKARRLLSPVCGEDVLPGLVGCLAEPFLKPVAGISTADFL